SRALHRLSQALGRARAMSNEGKYRRGVGVMLLNSGGKVFVGARIDNTDEAWQMPQGGMDEGEEPWATALRELEEETGIAPHLVVPFKRDLYRRLLSEFADHL